MTISKSIAFILKFSRSVIALGRSHAEAIAAGLVRQYGPGAFDGPGIATQINQHCDLLSTTTEEYEVSQAALTRDLAEDVLARAACDEKSAQLGKLLIGARTRVRENFSQDALHAYHLTQRLPANREAAARYVNDVITRLRSQPRVATDLISGNQVSTENIAAALEQALREYHVSLNDLAREARETQTARAARDRAEARFRVTLTNVAAILEAYLRLAGFDELADRVRPTYSRTTGEPETDGSDIPADDADTLPDDGDIIDSDDAGTDADPDPGDAADGSTADSLRTNR